MPTPTPGPLPNGSSPTVLAALDPWMLIVIILATLGCLMLSLWLVYSYINNIRTTDIHRKMLYDAVFDARFRELKGPDALQGSWIQSADQLEMQRRSVIAQLEEDKAQLERLSKVESPDRNEVERLETNIRYTERSLKNELSEAAIAKLRVDEEKAKSESRVREQALRDKAAQEANTLVPPSLTVAGMGITGSFFIELTAILTIIFGIIILGLVGVLGTQEISPILAAIAGYVLGKTTTRSQPTQPPPPSSYSPSSESSESEPSKSKG